MTYIPQFSEASLQQDLKNFWREAAVMGQAARQAPKGEYVAKLQGLADLMRKGCQQASDVRDNGSQFFWASMQMAVYEHGSDLSIPLCAALLILKREKFPVPDEALRDVSRAMVANRRVLEKIARNLGLVKQQYH